VQALIRSLPKSLRTRFVPAPRPPRNSPCRCLCFGEGDIRAASGGGAEPSGRHLGSLGTPFREPPADGLRMNVRVTDAEGRLLASDPRSGGHPRRQLGQQAAKVFRRRKIPAGTAAV